MVKYRTESTSAAASSRSALFLPNFKAPRGPQEAAGASAGGWRLSCGIAVAQQRPHRHHPSRYLQSLRQTRDYDRVPPASTNPSSNPNGVSNTAWQIASTSSHSGSMPASASGGLIFCFPAFAALSKCVPASFSRLRLGVSQQMRQVRQALPVDLSRNRLHHEFLYEEDPCWDRRRRELFGEGRRHPVSPRRRRRSDDRDLSCRKSKARRQRRPAPRSGSREQRLRSH